MCSERAWIIVCQWVEIESAVARAYMRREASVAATVIARPPAADLSFSHMVQTIKHTVNPEQQLTNKWAIASGLK